MLFVLFYRKEFEDYRPEIHKFVAAYNKPRKIVAVLLTVKGGQENGFVNEKGGPYDFGSRFFAPWVAIPEDPICGTVSFYFTGLSNNA